MVFQFSGGMMVQLILDYQSQSEICERDPNLKVQKGDKQNVNFPQLDEMKTKLTILILKIRILRLFQKWWRAS